MHITRAIVNDVVFNQLAAARNFHRCLRTVDIFIREGFPRRRYSTTPRFNPSVALLLAEIFKSLAEEEEIVDETPKILLQSDY